MPSSMNVNRNIVLFVSDIWSSDRAETTPARRERERDGGRADDLHGAGTRETALISAGSGVKEPASKFQRTYFVPTSLPWSGCGEMNLLSLVENDFINAAVSEATDALWVI